MSDVIKSVVVWRSLLIEGVEHCELLRTGEGFAIRGTVLGVLKGLTLESHYEVDCDERWRTHRVGIAQRLGKEFRRLNLSVEAAGHWSVDGQELSALGECIDVDLSITPATNTLPIRRLQLQPGQTQHVTAAWVKFPELSIQPLKQSYTRLSKSTYRYESATGFTAEIVVDEAGLVVSYPRGWERLASS